MACSDAIAELFKAGSLWRWKVHLEIDNELGC